MPDRSSVRGPNAFGRETPIVQRLYWVHVRTTDPIESVFAAVRLRHDEAKGSGSRTACLTMVFKLMESASKGWRSLNGSPLLAEVVRGTKFIDGIREEPAA
jgi:putative transposase